jgi:hypothetical protein
MCTRAQGHTRRADPLVGTGSNQTRATVEKYEIGDTLSRWNRSDRNASVVHSGLEIAVSLPITRTFVMAPQTTPLAKNGTVPAGLASNPG